MLKVWIVGANGQIGVWLVMYQTTILKIKKGILPPQ